MIFTTIISQKKKKKLYLNFTHILIVLKKTMPHSWLEKKSIYCPQTLSMSLQIKVYGSLRAIPVRGSAFGGGFVWFF